ncbi:MAG: DUF4147 domain-containing protein [Gemmatimonadales bacterium]|nr:DUF4147 domain-containing protein [Gemmatimonadales bacterium]
MTAIHDPRALLRELYDTAIAAADPHRALRTALERVPLTAAPIHLLALGKAAEPMARAAVAHLAAAGRAPAGGVCVGPAPFEPPHPALPVVTGDHPEPGDGSFAAAEALGDAVARIGAASETWVLLSGGATALLGAPVPGVAREELRALYALLLGSGLDITAMNRIRKRFSRWGGGKLAVAIPSAAIRVFIVSDVIGDDLASIASGPCVPDPATAAEVRAALEAAGLWPKVPPTLRERLALVERGDAEETPKGTHPAFGRVTSEIVASNWLAVEAVASRAIGLGLAARAERTPLQGEASVVAGSVIAAATSYSTYHFSQDPAPRPAFIYVQGGETTVTLGPEADGLGGRSQELALAAARALDGQPGIALLAGGTDGRDGPTDAAGAVVDGSTWAEITATGRDPADHLRRHDAFHALDAVGALLRPGMTGTNVMDVVVVMVGGR